MKAWVYKIYLQYFAPIHKNKLKYGGTWFSLLGAIFTIVEIENSVLESKFLLTLFRNHLGLFVAGITLVTIITLAEKSEFSEHLGEKDCILSLKMCNLLKAKNSAIVIPTNTTFDTTMCDEFISVASIQGKFQKEEFSNDLSKLDELLQNSLDEHYPTQYEELTDRTNTKKRRYEIGSVAKVVHKGTHYYFLAVADVSPSGKPQNVTMMSITKALVGLWDFLSKFGHIEPVSLPVIGTGRAGLKDGNYEEVVKEILFTFACAQQENHIAKGLNICLYPSDLKHANTSWDRLCEHLKYQCSFSKKNREATLHTKDSGQPIE